jgi:proline iminopeptidase
MTTGYVQSGAGELFYERRGEGGRAPLVCVHGGPGFTGFYLETLFVLSDLLPVVCYDQAGCGRARRGGARSSFTLAGFVDELEQLRRELGCQSMHLLGHSFGGAIIGEYILAHPQHVASAVFASASIDIPRWVADGERLVSKLPLMQRMILNEGKRSGQLLSPQYQDALARYYDQHVYGVSPLPERIQQSIDQADSITYTTVWGPNELIVTGMARDYSLTPRLGEIRCPTLFTCGRFDEATPEAHEFFASQVQGARCVVFEKSAHHPQETEGEGYVALLREFLGAER